ncbi:TonB family protein [Horticoccus luteus]|uniref:TonB family protein n=1 Tax=Horticoccus luteus TaxID=2862869 RepID=A0A8F9TZ11_9BACT|nr:energy transducer TonB [Horticoccus luteus]QYM80622.1 TonB family protein [Horticoccus luteus]
MKRHFAWPIGIAAALHLALLFGFRSPSRPPSERPVDPPVMELKPAPIFDEPIPVDAENSGGGGKPDVALPHTEEALRPPKPNDIVIPTIPSPPASQAKLIRIPAGTFGPGHGESSGFSDVGGPVMPVALDHAPRTRSQVGPVYPFEARKDGLSGEVLVEFTVDQSGHVHSARVVRSTATLFEAAALKAVAKWQFEPGRVHGRPVAFRLAVPIVFSLEDGR